MREHLLLAIVILDLQRIRRTQQVSDFVHSFTNSDCFDQRNWCARVLAGSLILVAVSQLIPFTWWGLIAAAVNSLNATQIFYVSLGGHGRDEVRRRHPDFINPEACDPFYLFSRTMFAFLTVFMFWIVLFELFIGHLSFTMGLAAFIAVTASATLHLDACQPRPPTPMLQLAPDCM